MFISLNRYHAAGRTTWIVMVAACMAVLGTVVSSACAQGMVENYTSRMESKIGPGVSNGSSAGGNGVDIGSITDNADVLAGMGWLILVVSLEISCHCPELLA